MISKEDLFRTLGFIVVFSIMVYGAVSFGKSLGERSRLREYKDSIIMENLKLDIQIKKLKLDSLNALEVKPPQPQRSPQRSPQR